VPIQFLSESEKVFVEPNKIPSKINLDPQHLAEVLRIIYRRVMNHFPKHPVWIWADKEKDTNHRLCREFIMPSPL
jgi:hypothetical protein